MKTKTILALAVFGAVGIAAVCVQYARSPEITAIHPQALIVDVRSAKAYQKEHVTGAINIPLGELEDCLTEFGGLDTQIIVYCEKGVSSAIAKRKLLNAGYSDVKNGGGLRDMLEMQR